jgi:DNA-binding NarL/FixJ family response regulator
MPKIRLVIAEGRTLFRQGLAALLHAEADFVVVGEAANAEEAGRVCTHTRPDLILLSAGLPDTREEGTPALLPRLRVCCPDAAIVVLGKMENLEAQDDAAHCAAAQAERRRALGSGADAYLHVGLDREELLRTLRAIIAARLCLDNEARDDGAAEAGTSPASRTDESGLHEGVPKNAITERERSILTLIAQGLCNKEIAHRLGISTQTVKNHVSHLLEKLALADRTQLAVYALEQGVGRKE